MSIVLAIAAIAGAIVYKKYFSPVPDGFPGYFLFLAVGELLLPAARPVINWRALSLTMFILLFASLMWEATLALPYGWWNFQDRQMIGIRIRAWTGLPVEEVFLWIGVTYATVIVYEVVRRWDGSGRFLGHALIGPSPRGNSPRAVTRP